MNVNSYYYYFRNRFIEVFTYSHWLVCFFFFKLSFVLNVDLFQADLHQTFPFN